MTETHLAVFRGRKIRKTLHNNEWWFAIIDVVSVLTESIDPAGYIKDMRRRDEELSKGWGQIAIPLSIETEGSEVATNCHGLKLVARDGKMRESDYAYNDGIFSIIQSIPYPMKRK